MRIFLDTSVLVPAFYRGHQHHPPSFDLLLQHGKSNTYVAMHSLAEVYASLTAMPGKQRMSGEGAMLYLASIRERANVVALTESEFLQALQHGAANHIASGGIYDALIGECALKAKVDVLFTWNTKHFLRLRSQIAALVRRPEPSPSEA